MTIRISNILGMGLFLCFIISATSVSNPIADIFQISGSIKVSDIFFLALALALFFSKKFIPHVSLAIKSSPITSLLLILYVTFIILSMLANLEHMGGRMFSHFLRLLYYLLIVYVTSYICCYYLSAMNVMKAMYLGAVLMSGSILYMMFFLGLGSQYGDGFRKLDSVLGGNPIGAYTGLLFPIGLIWLKQKTGGFRKIIIGASLFLLVTAALLAESKAAWLAMLISFFLFFLFLNRRGKIMTMFFSLLIGIAAFKPIYIIIEREITSSGSNSRERYDFALQALAYFTENPLFGIGSSNYVIVSPLGHEPHSAYALILAELGLFGFLFYVFLLLSIFVGLYLDRDDEVNQLLIMLITNIAVLSLFTGLVASQITLFVFIGAYIGRKLQRKGRSKNLKENNFALNDC